jgi:hypothetical protein
MSTRGRPTTLTDPRQEQIVGFIRQGLAPEVAAQACGVSRSAFYGWTRRGRDDREKHPDPTLYTRHQLKAIAADQNVDLTDLTKPTRQQVATRLYQPTRVSDFVDAVEKAQAEAQSYILARCVQAGQDDWRMWMTILERRFGWVRPEPVVTSEPNRDQGDPAAAVARARVVLKVLDGEAHAERRHPLHEPESHRPG